MNNNLKPFDLKLALEGAKVITRDGATVTEFHYFETKTDNYLKIVFAIGGCITWCGIKGNCSEQYSHPNDLFMAPVTVERWVNVYKAPDTTFKTLCEELYESEPIAKRFAQSQYYIGSYPIPITL